MSEPETASNESNADQAKRHKLGVWLSIILVAALILGPGPGILLVNTPSSILGLPAVYAWGLLWYLVEVGVVIAFYKCVWRNDE